MDESKSNSRAPQPCACVADAFAALPPEQRPQHAPEMRGLRKVTCPSCGLAYWTNRQSDVCNDCEKKRAGGQLDHPDR